MNTMRKVSWSHTCVNRITRTYEDRQIKITVGSRLPETQTLQWRLIDTIWQTMLRQRVSFISAEVISTRPMMFGLTFNDFGWAIMKDAWKFDFNQGLFMTFEIYTCMSCPLLKNLQRGHPCNCPFFVYFSQLHRIIPTIYFAGVLVMISTPMHFLVPSWTTELW